MQHSKVLEVADSRQKCSQLSLRQLDGLPAPMQGTKVKSQKEVVDTSVTPVFLGFPGDVEEAPFLLEIAMLSL